MNLNNLENDEQILAQYDFVDRKKVMREYDGHYYDVRLLQRKYVRAGNEKLYKKWEITIGRAGVNAYEIATVYTNSKQEAQKMYDSISIRTMDMLDMHYQIENEMWKRENSMEEQRQEMAQKMVKEDVKRQNG